MRSNEASELIASCRSRNSRHDITGVLLYTGERFLQLIEGPPAAVGALWRNVHADDRHGDLVVLLDVQSSARWFDDWRAGYVSERALAPLLKRWESQAPQLSDDELENLRALLQRTPAS